jgi:hypothetical protein
MGTGVSLGIPNMGHVVSGKCDSCRAAWTDPHSKDRRVLILEA